MIESHIRIVHVEDEEEYTKLVAKVLEQVKIPTFSVEWISDFNLALEKLCLNEYDLCLVDYQLGEKNGIDLIKEAKRRGCTRPFVMLTGFGNRRLDFETMESGADAYLEKAEIATPVFERTLRYTIEQHKHEIELQEVKEQLTAIVDESDFASWEWDVVSNQLTCTPASATLLGYASTHDFLNQRDWITVRHPEDLSKALSALEQYTKGENKYYEVEQRLLGNDGHWKWMLERGKASEWDDQQRPVKMTGLYFDINEFKQNEQELFISKETSKRLMRVMKSLHEQTTNYAKKAEHASKIKSEFLANMSHDIRTPLTSIEGITELLMKDELPEDQRDYLTSIQESSNALMELVENILDLSKIESGNLTLEEKQFNLEDLIYEITEVLHPKINQQQVEMVCDIAPLNYTLLGDPLRLKQVLTNLLGNALKFTAKGEIALVVEIIDEKEKDLQLLFSVCDTGIGLEQEHIETIFQPFKQAKPDIGIQFGGTGLGLTICKQLVEMMGGEMKVKSVPQEGTTFQFLLNFRRGEAIIPYWKDLSETLKSKRLLIIDDCQRNHHLFEHLTTMLGVEIDYCVSLSEADHKIVDTFYDVLFVDADMLITSENKWLNKFKKNHVDPIVPVVGLFHSLAQRKNTTLSFTRSLIKPLAQKKVIAILKQLFGEPLKQIPSDVKQSFFKQELRGETILLVEDQRTSQMIEKKIINQCGFPVVTASDGKEAMEKALNQSFDLIFMDMEMPHLDGLEVTKRLRKQGIKTPIIALTAYTLKGDMQKYFDAGMNDYVSKPLRRHTVREKLSRYLGISNLEEDRIISNLKTLIVSDSKKQLENLIDNFRTLWPNETFKQARTGIEAAIIIGRLQPNLLVLKMELPDIDGFQLIQTIKKDVRYKEMKMILLSDNKRNYHINKLRKKGKLDILDEYPDFDQLETAIRKLFVVEEAEVSEQEQVEDIIDEKSASLGFNADDYKIVLESFLKATSNNLSNLDSAIKGEKDGELKRLAHAIKGSARTIRFDDIALVAEKLEAAVHKNDKQQIEQYYSKLVDSFDEMQQAVKPQLADQSTALSDNQPVSIEKHDEYGVLKKLIIELENVNQKRNITAVINLSGEIGIIAESMSWIELVHQARLIQRHARQADFKSVNTGIEQIKGMVR